MTSVFDNAKPLIIDTGARETKHSRYRQSLITLTSAPCTYQSFIGRQNHREVVAFILITSPAGKNINYREKLIT